MGNAVEYLAVESPIHRLNPLTKLTGVFTLFILGLLFANPLVLLSVMFLVICFYFLAKAGKILAWYSKPLLGVAVFLLFIQVLFSHEGVELFRYIPKSIPVFGWIGAVHKDSLLLGLTMITRMGVFALTLPLLLATTQPRDLTLVLVDKLMLPYDYAFMFITSLRFIPTLFIEMDQISQAQGARGFDLSAQPLFKRIKSYMPLVVPLVMIALKKAEHLAMAMETRGYGAGKRSYLRKLSFTSLDGLINLCFCCLLAVSVLSKVIYHLY